MALFSNRSPTLSEHGEVAEAFGLRSPPPSIHLKKILSNYPEGSQIFKEGLQNADDASATTYVVSLDEKRTTTTVPDLERFMGASILLYNDAEFSHEDWSSLQNMFESKKESSFAKIGKFGMGSRSYFHMADIMFVVSGSTFAYIDPDQILTDTGGEKLDFVKMLALCRSRKESSDKNLNILTKLESHLRPFVGHMGFQIDKPFQGTMIRLPLRIAKFARLSKFAPYEYNVVKTKKILEHFQVELSECMLFLQSIHTVRIMHRPEGEEHANTIIECTTTVFNAEDEPKNIYDYLGDASNWIPRPPSPLKTFLDDIDSIEMLRDRLLCAASGSLPQITQTLRIQQTIMDTAVQLDGHEEVVTVNSQLSLWKVLCQFITSSEIIQMLSQIKTAPTIGVAGRLHPLTKEVSLASFSDYSEHGKNSLQLDDLLWPQSDVNGSLFTFLPILDVNLGLPIHLHANFCLKDNRRDLWLDLSGDTEGQAKLWSSWNRLILNNFLPPLYAALLASMNKSSEIIANWPDPLRAAPILKPFLHSFSHAIKDLPLFEAADGLQYEPRHITFLKMSNKTKDSIKIITSRRISPTNCSAMLRVLSETAMSSKGLKVLLVPDKIRNVLDYSTRDCAEGNDGHSGAGRFKTISFLGLMHNIILPYWSNLNVQQISNVEYFLHWMLVLCQTLSQSTSEEILQFKSNCEELRFIPVEKKVKSISNDVLNTFDDEDDNDIHRNKPYALSSQRDPMEQPVVDQCERYVLISPKDSFDTSLKTFLIASRGLPAGLFGSPAVTKVLRIWGLKQSLSWSDLTQEIALRFCSGTMLSV